MYILLIMRLTCLKTAIGLHAFRIHLKGRVSQNFDIGLSFDLTGFRRGDFQNITIKSQKLPFLALK